MRGSKRERKDAKLFERPALTGTNTVRTRYHMHGTKSFVSDLPPDQIPPIRPHLQHCGLNFNMSFGRDKQTNYSKGFANIIVHSTEEKTSLIHWYLRMGFWVSQASTIFCFVLEFEFQNYEGEQCCPVASGLTTPGCGITWPCHPLVYCSFIHQFLQQAEWKAVFSSRPACSALLHKGNDPFTQPQCKPCFNLAKIFLTLFYSLSTMLGTKREQKASKRGTALAYMSL